MTTDVVAVSLDTTVEVVAQMLVNHNLGKLLVIDEFKVLKGFISEFELLVIVVDPIAKSDPVSQHMDTDTYQLEETATLEEVAELLYSKRLHRVPIHRDGVVTGTIGPREILRYLIEFDEPVPDNLRRMLLKLSNSN